MTVEPQNIQVGNLVRVKESTLANRGDHAYSHETSIVERFYSDIPGGVRLQDKIAGFYSWNVEDLIVVTDKASQISEKGA